MLNITVVGTGYVGLSNAMLFSKKHKVISLDIDSNRVNLLNERKSPIKDDLIQQYLLQSKFFCATLDTKLAYDNADVILIATPTNYDEDLNNFDTSSIEQILSHLNQTDNSSIIVIKSTVPVGFTLTVKKKYPELKIIFSPEFLREGQALFDNLYPSRIVIGDMTQNGTKVGLLFKESALKADVQIIQTNETEAEAVKLFSNAYLAMRIAYFNELDTYCEIYDLNSKDIIQAISLDSRIGDYYNNPSFGYGGYCLPKDTMQLLADYKTIPQNLIEAIVKSNNTRKKFIANQILSHSPIKVGVFLLGMKQNSDNFRKSAVQDIIEFLKEEGVETIIYEPTLDGNHFCGSKIVNDLVLFKQSSDIIIANRLSPELSDVSQKIYTRDIFGDN